MAIYAFSEMEDGRVRRIYASAKYPSMQSGNIFFDSQRVPDLRHADELPLVMECMFSVVAFRPSHVLLSRDVLGGKPLYYGTDMSFSSFRSYIDGDAVEVLPGEVVKIDYEGNIVERKKYAFEDVFTRVEIGFEEAAEVIEKTLRKVKPRVACIAFSGGLDSSLLAAIYDLPLVAVTASDKDEEWIRKAAKILGCELELWRVREEDIEWAAGEVIKAIETDDFLQVSIGVPVYLVMDLAKRLGFTEIVFGQGADELFGGYKRYEGMTEYELEEALLRDVKEIGEKNVVRDTKIAYRKEIKILTPYLEWDVIRAALSIPASMKVRKENGRVIRKYALRKIAEKYLPREIAWREKKAIQYSTGIAKVLKKKLSG